MTEQHKRASVRLPYRTPIRLRIEGGEWSGHIENFSTKGVLISLNKGSGQRLPSQQSQGILLFQMDEVDFEVPVSVVRSVGHQLGVAFMTST